ncbi:MAG: carboxypeptidase regulatory-like domain-containing protein [Gemmatimonadaceae bacterium]|nr:carboxypeptidase regulatory-like domain-containing protein [Gemmatimonadaceae bacterium]
MIARLLVVILALLLVVTSSGSLRAQGTIRGVVLDSLFARGPLAGATVMLQGAPQTAVSDKFGRFVLRDVPAGRYQVAFFHPILDSLEISAAPIAVDVRDGAAVPVTLGMPSVARVAAALCGTGLETSTGVVFGVVRDAERAMPLDSVEIGVHWYVATFEQGALRESRAAVRTRSASDGRYVLCGVPNDVATTLVAERGAQRTGDLQISLADGDLARRDLLVSLSDTAARRTPLIIVDTLAPTAPPGSARLRVRVVDARGRVVSGALVGVRGSRASATTDADGRVFLTRLPSGSQSLLVRKVGQEPVQQVVGLRPGTDVEATVLLDRRISVLPTVAVTGRAVNKTRLDQDIDRRVKAGFGYLYDEKAVRRATSSLSFWATVPGVRVVNDGFDALPIMRDGRGDMCVPNILFDGTLISNIGAWELRTYLVGSRRMEVYPYAGTRPAEFPQGIDCGVIAIWSR